MQIGAGVASFLARRAGLGKREVQALVPIGAAAALAAAFNTPMAAVLFTVEELLGDLNARLVGSVVIGAATSWMVLHLFLGDAPLFRVPPYSLMHPTEFLFYALLGIAGGCVSVLFSSSLLWLRLQYRRLPKWTLAFQPATGGLAAGVLALYSADVLGAGYAAVELALHGQLSGKEMLILLVLKLAATVVCYSSGNAGGIFGPSLFLGAMLGGGFGSLLHGWLPATTAPAGAYALVGMGTTFAGVVRSPITSVVMIFELTRDYNIIVPLMISNLVAYAVARAHLATLRSTRPWRFRTACTYPTPRDNAPSRTCWWAMRCAARRFCSALLHQSLSRASWCPKVTASSVKAELCWVSRLVPTSTMRSARARVGRQWPASFAARCWISCHTCTPTNRQT